MKQLIMTIIMVSVIACNNAHAETRAERDTRKAKIRLEQQMQRTKSRIYENCIMDTRIRNRVSWKKNVPAANRCYQSRYNDYLLEQQILSDQLTAEAVANRSYTKRNHTTWRKRRD